MIDHLPQHEPVHHPTLSMPRSEKTCGLCAGEHLECGGCQTALCPQRWDHHVCPSARLSVIEEPVVSFRLSPIGDMLDSVMPINATPIVHSDHPSPVDCVCARGMNDPICASENDDGKVCTRPPDHLELHVACGLEHRVAEWR